IAAVAFALQNNSTVTVTLGIWSFDSSLAMVLLIATGIGAVIAVLLSWPTMLKNMWTSSRLRRQINRLEAEKDTLERRVGQLEAELARVSPEPIPQEPPRYLGLKSILVGSETEKPKE
ncbi:MAG TPA: LapA family protein, partial [Nitrosospira sp.]|nr:LapA family protein [Nitrosospira sp.]